MAACLPILFLHVRWQPGFALSLGGTAVDAYLSDFAVLAVVLLAVAAGLRQGFAALRGGRAVWIAAALFLGWIAVELILGRSRGAVYPWQTHAVTAAKYAEYSLLAPSLPLLLRRQADILALLWSLALWSVAATVVGIVQLAGARVLVYGGPGSRQGSFLSYADFAALSAAVLIVGLVALALPRLGLGRLLGVAAMTAGAAGVALAAALASILGLVMAGILLAAVATRDFAVLGRRVRIAAAAVAAAAAAAVLLLRGGDIRSYGHFLTAPSAQSAPQKSVQTYSQHTLLIWIGLQIWTDHPLVGAGWEASEDPATFMRYLPAARKRFPTEPAAAFPSPQRRFGVQNMWVEALADLGIVGLVLLVTLFASVAAVAWRATKRAGGVPALIGLLWTALVAALWAAQGFVAGIPLDALTWLAFGFAATGAALCANNPPYFPQGSAERRDGNGQ